MRYRVLRLEAELANRAEHVFTLTRATRDELLERGVTVPITLLPNSCDADRFKPRARDMELAQRLGIAPETLVIGYVGSFFQYEGLDDLTKACVLLAERGMDFQLLLVGQENGSGSAGTPVTTEIAQIAEMGGLKDRLIMPGHVPYGEIENYYSLIDLSTLPAQIPAGDRDGLANGSLLKRLRWKRPWWSQAFAR